MNVAVIGATEADKMVGRSLLADEPGAACSAADRTTLDWIHSALNREFINGREVVAGGFDCFAGRPP